MRIAGLVMVWLWIICGFAFGTVFIVFGIKRLRTEARHTFSFKAFLTGTSPWSFSERPAIQMLLEGVLGWLSALVIMYCAFWWRR